MHRRADIPGTVNMGASAAATVSSSQRDPVPNQHAWLTGVSLIVRARKALLSLRIDRDVLEWFRASGPGYQTRMNAVLRAYMEYARNHG
jgi:uncharacterized protein (DUF4415 family)